MWVIKEGTRSLDCSLCGGVYEKAPTTVLKGTRVSPSFPESPLLGTLFSETPVLLTGLQFSFFWGLGFRLLGFEAS